MLFGSIKERIEHLSEKLVNMPRAGIEPMAPCILVRSANHYTIKDHNAGNVAVYRLGPSRLFLFHICFTFGIIQ